MKKSVFGVFGVFGGHNCKRAALLMAFAVAALAFSGCEQGTGGSPGGKGTLTVSLQFGGAGTGGEENVLGVLRTVYPDVAGFTKYEITFEATDGGASHDPVVITDPDEAADTIEVDLVAGTYDITVTAYTGSPGAYTVAATGVSTGVTVTAGENDPLTILMGPATGNGTFSYDVTIPSGASGTLTITTMNGGEVSDGTKTLNDTSNTGTVTLAAGNYLLAVSLTKSGEEAKFDNEVIYIYPGLTSIFAKEFTVDHFRVPDPGSLGMNIFFAFENIPVSETDEITITKGGESTTLTVSQDAGFTDITWYVDGGSNAISSTSSVTLDPDEYGVGIHFLTVTATKNGKPYSEILEFTVEAAGGGGITLGQPVSAENLAAYLALIPDGTTTESPHTVKLDSSVNVSSDTWGTTVKNALTGLDKYITLDLGDCTATDNTITGGNYNPTGNAFNVFIYNNANPKIVGIILPNDLEIIGNNALYYATGIKSVTMPDSIISIGNSAFAYTPLSEITIPELVTSIGTGTFTGCTTLTSVIFEGSNVEIGNTGTFPNNLKDIYESFVGDNRIGTYTKTSNSWEKTN
jgi:hypothetical protein